MAFKTHSFRRYSIQIVAIVILGALLGIYFFTYVPSNQRYIADRNQRILAVMAGQIKAKVENFGTVLKNIVHDTSKTAQEDKISFIKDRIGLVPNLELSEEPDSLKLETRKDEVDLGRHDHLHVHEVLDGADYSLHFEYMSPDFGEADTSLTALAIHAETNLTELIAPVASRKEFDDILLVKLRGTIHTENEKEQAKKQLKHAQQEEELKKVIFQRDRSDLQVVKLDSLEDKEGNKLALSSLANTSFVKEASLAGSDFTVFGHPVLISFYKNEIENEKAMPAKWLLCGLIETSRFQAESRKISNSYIIIFMFLALTALLSIPIMKVKFMGPQDTLERLDLIFLALSLLVLTSLVTIIILDFYIYHSHGKLFDRQLEEFAEEMKQNFRQEIESAYSQLESLNRSYRASSDSVIQTDILDEADEYDLHHYPYFEMAYWIDSEGDQKAKWTVKKYTTPFINLEDRPYFRRHIYKQSFSLGPGGKRRYILQPIHSWTTGQNETVLSIPFSTTTNPNDSVEAESKLDSIAVSALSMHLLSLNAPVVPPGFGFAVIENSGRVLYHSDGKRNLQENFFEECENDPSLQATVYGRADEHLNVKYWGREHRLFITPIESPPWTLIVFRSKDVFGTVNMELLTIAAALLIVYIGFLVAVIGGTTLLFRRYLCLNVAALWPDKQKHAMYRQLVVALFVLNLLFFLGILMLRFNPTSLLIFVFAGAAAALIFVCFFLQRGKPLWKATEPSRKTITRDYVFIWFLLLVLIGVLPAMSFFNFAYHTEAELLVKHGQFKLAEALETRAARLNETYYKIDGKLALDIRNDRLSFQDSNDAWQSIEKVDSADIDASDRYSSFFFDTHLANNRRCGTAFSFRSHFLEHELVHRMLLHNPTSTEMRELIHDAAGDTAWHWNHARDASLILHRRNYNGGECLEIASTLPTIDRALDYFSYFASWRRLIQLLFVLFVLLGSVGLFLVLRAIVRKVFLMDLLDFTSTEESKEISTGHREFNNILLLHPTNGKKESWMNPDDVYVIDFAKPEYRSSEYLSSALPKDKTVVIDHFEFRMTSPEVNREKLCLLEDLILTHEKNVVIFSTVDPMSFSFENSQENGQEAERWRTILEHFRGVLLLDRGDPEKFRAKMNTLDRPIQGALLDECSPTACLQNIAEELMASRRLQNLTEEQLIEQVEKYAHSHYQSIWSACSNAEKLALVDLAKDGFINYEDHQTISNLLSSGLIRQQPEFRLMNESFRRFVLSGDRPEFLRQQQGDVKSSWGKLKVPLAAAIIGVILFLFYTQPSMFRSTISIISGITAGIPALFKLLSSLKLGKSETAAA